MHESLELLRDGVGLRVGFEQQTDRYAHRIYLIGSDSHLLLSSIEGDDQNVWPPSPPLQHLAIEQRPQGSTVALAVGMAGRSHWSLSAAVEHELLQIVFDIACRYSDGEQREKLGSTYRIHAIQPNRCEEYRAAYTLTCGMCVVRIEPLDDAQIELTDDSVLRIKPMVDASSPPSDVRTSRWRYRMELKT